MELALQASRASLEQSYNGEVYGGLYHGIAYSDIASNVILVKNGERKLNGGRMNTTGMLSRREYGTVSMINMNRS